MKLINGPQEAEDMKDISQYGHQSTVKVSRLFFIDKYFGTKITDVYTHMTLRRKLETGRNRNLYLTLTIKLGTIWNAAGPTLNISISVHHFNMMQWEKRLIRDSVNNMNQSGKTVVRVDIILLFDVL